MDEKLLEILNQYDLNVRNTYRGRGATICITDQGVKILKEFRGSAGKLLDEYQLKNGLMEQGFLNVDQYVKSREDSFFVLDRYKVTYVMKDYFEGKECDIRSLADIKLAGENLGKFHQAAKKLQVSERTMMQYKPLHTIFQKRNRELKRVRNYMSTVQKKGDFELIYISNFALFWGQAESIWTKMKELPEELFQKRVGICHGEYNHHNVLKIGDKIATINLDRFYYGSQLMDLHQFLRKALEKNNYNMEVAKQLLDSYGAIIELEQSDYFILSLLLSYPEKSYKISNHYYNSKKCWIPPKTIEKLNETLKQNEKKEKFLESYLKEYL